MGVSASLGGNHYCSYGEPAHQPCLPASLLQSFLQSNHVPIYRYPSRPLQSSNKDHVGMGVSASLGGNHYCSYGEPAHQPCLLAILLQLFLQSNHVPLYRYQSRPLQSSNKGHVRISVSASLGGKHYTESLPTSHACQPAYCSYGEPARQPYLPANLLQSFLRRSALIRLPISQLS